MQPVDSSMFLTMTTIGLYLFSVIGNVSSGIFGAITVQGIAGIMAILAAVSTVVLNVYRFYSDYKKNKEKKE